MTSRIWSVFSLVAALALGGWVVTSALAQKSPNETEQLAAARELLDVSGSAKQFDTVMPLMLEQMKGLFLQMAPQHSKEIGEAMDLMGQRFNSRKFELMDQIVKIYAETMSSADMAEISKFFKSEVGARFVKAQPELLEKSMRAGQNWGRQIGTEIEKEMREELKKRGVPI